MAQVLAYTATEEFGATDIPRREVDPGSLALVLVFDESRLPWGGRKGGMLTVTRLNPSLTKRLSLPETLVEIEDRTGLFHKQGPGGFEIVDPR